MRSHLLSPREGSEEPRFSASEWRTNQFEPWRLRHHCWPLAAIVTVVAVILLSVAVAKPYFYHQSLSTPVGTATIDIGLFQLCYHLGGTEDCRDIDSQCSITVIPGADFKGQILDNCDEFNASRALLIVAIVVLALAVGHQSFAALNWWVMGNSVLSLVFGVVGSVLALAAMALVVDIHNSDAATLFAGIDYGYSFTLLVVAWPLSLLASCCFVPCVRASDIVEM